MQAGKQLVVNSIQEESTMSDLFALIVEDETDLAIIFSKALQEAGFETQIVRAGDTALMWLSSTTPQIVVLDLHLPRVSGKEVLEQIRADERLTETKVIIATADPRMAETLQDQADLVLLKPIGFSQLRDLASRLGFETS
jgi:two-component system cell cycle response regulator DivK